MAGFSRRASLLISAITFVSLGALLAWDVDPRLFPGNAHAVLGAFPLVAIAFALLAHRAGRRASWTEWLKAVLLAAAFLFWAANQWLAHPRASLVCNDIAITLFVLDIVLVIVGTAEARETEKIGCGAMPDGGCVCRQGGVCC